MKNLITLIVVIALVIAGYFGVTAYLHQRAGSEQATTNTITADFVSDSGESIHVVFDNASDVAILTGAGFDNVTLPRAISGSGARYENTDLGLVLWNKGNDITLTDHDTLVFSGTEKSAAGEMEHAGVQMTDPESGATFWYPESFGTTYVSPVDWPPHVALEDGTFSCSNAGTETSPAGKSETKVIDGREYCVTTEGEGAAGSVYTQYAYSAEVESTIVHLTFSVRMPQCLNYDEPQQGACKAEQDLFDPDTIAAGIFDSLSLSQ